MRQSKYGNKRVVTADGTRFDSRAEYARWIQLTVLEQAGEITDLDIHVGHPLFACSGEVTVTHCEQSIVVGHYVCDFSYWRGDEWIVEDVKGVRTPLYRLKAKLFRANFGIPITEVEA